MENKEKSKSDPQVQLKKLLLELELVERDQIPERFKAYFQSNCNSCSLEDFAIYYLAALRQHTDVHFRSGNESETSKCQTPVRQAQTKHTARDRHFNDSSFSQLSNSSPNNVSTTTPVRHQQQTRRSTGHQFSSTPQSSERSQGNRSGGNSSSVGNSICLGDFLPNTTPTQNLQRAKKKLTPNETNSVNNKSQKPRRRVLPMTISKNVSSCSSFGDTSSFSNENNLWRLTQSCELLDQSQGAALEQEARKSLLLHRQEIKSEAPVASVEKDREKERNLPNSNVVVSLEDVSNTKQLQLLAAIYGQLLDLNSVPNVLSEISYALNLLNIQPIVESPVSESESEHNKSEPLSLLSQYKECIYFAAKVLEQQEDLLLQLDRKSLAVLLQHDRITLLSNTLQHQLEVACQLKREAEGNHSGEMYSSNEQQNVYYQHDKDSRDNFPSQTEFGAFKTQRDLFYKALKHWEQCHLNRVFTFGREVAPLVRDIFKQSEHPVNMAHLAKLYVSQLVMSSGDTNESPEELGLKLDQLRLNRLAQRLVTSNSSVEDQFPRTQAFFRDFISECGSWAFLVQLQLALYVQLLRHNDSSFELLPLQPDEETQMASPLIVRPQALAEMLLLAKFLGYVCALPYNRSPTAYACPQQVQLRSQFQPPFELHTHLVRAMRQGKLLITLPWVVQYLYMLDLVTLQLPASLATLDILYTLYALAAPKQTPHLQPVAVLIMRICLGWLLESQPSLSTGYFVQRKSTISEVGGEEATVTLVTECLRSFCFLDKDSGATSMLKQLLPVACPFLHEFRVAIAPSQRQARRNGRYRYITTRLEQFSGSQHPTETQTITERSQSQVSLMEQQQRKLNEAFLHSQSASMRRLLEFVTERCFKCVVKDAQHEILLPSKSAADALVNDIRLTQQHEVQRELQRIYQQARVQASQQWADKVPAMLDKRIEQSLLALLPANIHDVLRRTYAHLIKQQARTQLQHWLQTSVLQSNFYHGDLQEVASKVCRANKNSAQAAANSSGVIVSNELCLPEDCELSLSQVLHDLQQWVHCLSLRPDHIHHLIDLQKLIDQSRQAVLLPKLPTYFYQLVGSTLVRLLQLIICRQPQQLTQPLIHACCEVWLAPQLRSIYSPASPDFFQILLNVDFISELSANPANFSLLHQLLHSVLDARVLRLDEINEFFMTLFKENWSPPVWTALSQMLKQLSQHSGNGDGTTNVEDDPKSQLFMEMLSDLSRDLDSF